MPLLLVIAVMVALQGGEMQLLWTTAIYGLALAAMIGASALFNLLREARLAWLYQRLDHSAIFSENRRQLHTADVDPRSAGVALLACYG